LTVKERAWAPAQPMRQKSSAFFGAATMGYSASRRLSHIELKPVSFRRFAGGRVSI
jgi:hypothetical protein